MLLLAAVIESMKIDVILLYYSRHPFRVTSIPNLPTVPLDFDDLFSQSSQKDILSTQAFKENSSTFGQSKVLGSKGVRQKTINVPVKITNVSQSTNELFHSPPRAELEDIEDEHEQYMYPDDSPELFPSYQSSATQDLWPKAGDEHVQGKISLLIRAMVSSFACLELEYQSVNSQGISPYELG